jgi:hypothetical protein
MRLLIALVLPWLTFFTIGRPNKTDRKIEKALGKN